MKRLTLTTVLLSSMITMVMAQTITEKTLVKAFNLGTNDYVELDLQGDVEIREWSQKIMRVQIDLAVENTSSATLKSLVSAGRYNLKSTETADGLLITAPGMNRTVTLRGETLKEHVSYVVFVPENVMVQMKDSASASVNE